MKVATRSPARTPRRARALARRFTRSATSVKRARLAPSSVSVTISLSPCAARPWRKMPAMVSGNGCMVLCIGPSLDQSKRPAMMLQVRRDERFDEPVAVIIALVHAQLERLPGGVAGGAQPLGLQMLDEG